MKSPPMVVTTRDRPGRLDELLSSAGIEVRHVPLIEIVDVQTDDERAAMLAAFDRIDQFDWLVVTSVHGAERAGGSAANSTVRMAAVGSATAARLRELAGRDVEVVPPHQTGADLVSVFPPPICGGRVLVAQADRAEPTVADGLAAMGYDVTVVVAYHTRLRHPSLAELELLQAADAVAFASSSAVQAWVESVGPRTPPVVAAIGPTTAGTATQYGLQVTHIAADHSVTGLATTIVDALTPST